MESVECEIRLLFIQQNSAVEKEAVHPGIKHGGAHTSPIYSITLWHLVETDTSSFDNDNVSNESVETTRGR